MHQPWPEAEVGPRDQACCQTTHTAAVEPSTTLEDLSRDIVHSAYHGPAIIHKELGSATQAGHERTLTHLLQSTQGKAIDSSYHANSIVE